MVWGFAPKSQNFDQSSRNLAVKGAFGPILQFSASEMTYIVSSGALNSTHSLTLPNFAKINTGIRRCGTKTLKIGL